MFDVINTLPVGFLHIDARELYTILPRPTLIHLPGKLEPALFISILAHGNETVGLFAVQQLLQRYEGRELPRALTIFVSNVSAAKEGVRVLPGQPDYNRVWPGHPTVKCREQEMMAEIVAIMRKRGVFLSVDVHNNTGLNPHYSCVNKLDDRFLKLATMFDRTVVYFTRPVGVQSLAFAALCPAVTLECGKVGDKLGVDHAAEYLDACLRLHQFEHTPVRAQDIDLFHTVAAVYIDPDVRFSFDEQDHTEMLLFRDVEFYNFRELSAGTPFARLEDDDLGHFLVRDEHGNQITEQYFYIENHIVKLKKSVMPSMMTLDTRVIRQDCLCYFMERCAYQGVV